MTTFEKRVESYDASKVRLCTAAVIRSVSNFTNCCYSRVLKAPPARAETTKASDKWGHCRLEWKAIPQAVGGDL
jgi:hypothetical protein